MPKICYNKWHKPETEETLCPDQNADASVPLPRCSSFGPLEGGGRPGGDGGGGTRPSASSTCWAAPRRVPPRWGGSLHGAAGVRDTARRRRSQALVEEAPAHLRRRHVLCPGRGPGRDCARRGVAVAGRCGRRVPAVQGKLGGYENENRGYLKTTGFQHPGHGAVQNLRGGEGGGLRPGWWRQAASAMARPGGFLRGLGWTP